MEELTHGQIERQDFVDNGIFDLIQNLNPTSTETEWDIEVIGQIRDHIRYLLVEKLQICDEMSFYPYLEE